MESYIRSVEVSQIWRAGSPNSWLSEGAELTNWFCGFGVPAFWIPYSSTMLSNRLLTPRLKVTGPSVLATFAFAYEYAGR
jgi:hypothetical protein